MQHLENPPCRECPNRQKYPNRHSRAGGNPDLSVQKLIGYNGFLRFRILDSRLRGNDGCRCPTVFIPPSLRFTAIHG
ncbi:hypothetical protein COH67_03625 [Neisseria meningitidis]|nr:hypothetical protein COH67_03625 [Neisseria meningitidis]